MCLFSAFKNATGLSHGLSGERDTITVSAAWTHEKGITKFVEREYSKGTGELLQIRDCSKVTRTANKLPAWCIPRSFFYDKLTVLTDKKTGSGQVGRRGYVILRM